MSQHSDWIKMPHPINLLISLTWIVVKIDFKNIGGFLGQGVVVLIGVRKGDTVKPGSMRKARPSVARKYAAAKTCV
jgi:hypothetical protein